MAGLFFRWLYADAPSHYAQNGKALLKALFNYFSIPFLFATLTEPWRHDAVDITRLPFREWGQAILNNGIARLIGLVVRSLVILAGGMVLVIVTVLWVAFLVAWYALPVLLVVSVLLGLQFIAGATYV